MSIVSQDRRAAEALVKRFETRAAASVAKFRKSKTAARKFLVKVDARVSSTTGETANRLRKSGTAAKKARSGRRRSATV